MGYRFESGETEPTGGGALLGLLLVLIATVVALIAYSGIGSSTTSAVNVYQPVEYSNEMTGSTGNRGAEPGVDKVTTTSFENANTKQAAPACNVSSCANAYRSFRVADCTFQPFEGPRRLCTRR